MLGILPPGIGPYIVLSPIAAGGFGAVAKCRHEDNQRIAAVKLAGSDPDHRGRLCHEARVLSRLGPARHRGVIELLDTGAEQGMPWIALSFVDGPTLASFYRGKRANNPESLAEVSRLGRRVAEALGHCHVHGVVHSDVSPSNILLAHGTEPILIDFGSAVVTFDGSAMREVGQSHLALHGTPGYAAPEQISGQLPDARSDLYALGCILYELISGLPPFRADTVEALCQQHLHVPPVALTSRVPWLPREIDDLILALLQKEPKSRPGRAEEVAEVLARFCDDLEPLPAPKASAWMLHRPQLIGRESTLQPLVEGLNEAAQGRGGLFLVSGRSGIGKTRLINELAHRARDFRVMFGRCGALTGGRTGQALEPFLPFLEWLANYRATPHAGTSAELDTAVAVLSEYEPALRAPQTASAVPSLPPELGRSRVLQSLLEVLLVASSARPLLLVIDDVQWADDLSRAFLHESYRTVLESSKVLIVVAQRSEEPEPALGADVRRIHLDPLSWDELGVMAMDMLGTELVPAGLAEALYRHSEGNPFFAAEYLRAFIECGFLSRTARSDWEFSEHRPGSSRVPIPSSLRDLFALRIGGLSVIARQVLEVSSLLGRQFRGELVEEIMRGAASGSDTRGALEELVMQRILDSWGVDRYQFVHDKLREAQAQAIPDGQRRSLHRIIAVFLDTADNVSRFEISPADLGVHWAEAGDAARAILHLQTAAEHAAAQYMNAKAADLYSLALSQIDAARRHLLNDEGALMAKATCLGEARGDVLGWSARHEEACKQWDDTLALVHDRDIVRRARLERKKANAFWTLHNYEQAKGALGRAAALIGRVEHLSESDERAEWIEIQQGFFWLHYFSRHTGSSTEQLMNRMADVVEKHGTSVQKSMFYECAVGDIMLRERYRYSERAVELARRATSEVVAAAEQLAPAAEARFSLAFVLVQGTPTQCREAVEILEGNVNLLTPVGEATVLTLSLVYLAIAWRRSGDVEATRLVSARARRSAERVRVIPYIGASLACESWVLWKMGDLGTARHRAEEACAWWAKAPHTFPFQWLAKLVLLDLHYLSDDFASAERVVLELLDPRQQRLEDSLDRGLAACSVCLRSNQPRTASLAIRDVLELASRHAYL